MGWVVMFTHQELSTPKCDGTCVDHARITLRARVIRATSRNFLQSSSYLQPLHIFHQKVLWRLQFYMEAAILIICYLAGFLVVLFCFYQLAGLLDKLTYQEPSIKVWLPKKVSTNHGPSICSSSLNKFVDYQLVTPHFAGSHDMLKFLSNSTLIDPPPKRKWDRTQTNQSKLKSTVRSDCVLISQYAQ